MRRATENQGNGRTLTEYFSPRSKVKDHAFQLRSPPHVSPLLLETPMKPSQVPNQLPHPPPRRMLPFQSPDMCLRDRLGPVRPVGPHPLGPNYSSGFVPSSPTNSANRPHLVPRDGLGPPQHSGLTPRSFCSRRLPDSPTDCGATYYRPQLSPTIFHPASSQFRDVSSHSPTSPIRRDQREGITLPHSGNKYATGQTQELHQVQSSDVRGSVHPVQLNRPHVTSSPNFRAAPEVYLLPLSDSPYWSPGNNQWSPRAYQPSPCAQPSDRTSGSSLPIMHSLIAPCQDQQHKGTPRSEKLISVDLNHSSQKRRREVEDSDDSGKKLRLQGANCGKTQTPKPTVGNSVSTLPSSRHSSVLERSPKTTDGHLDTEPACGQSTFKPTQSSCTSLSPKPCITKRLPMGAKQAYINSTQNYTVKLIESVSSSNSEEDSLKKRREENDKRHKLSSSLSSEDAGSSPHVHSHRSTSALTVKTLSKGNQLEGSRKSDSSTPKPASKSNAGSCVVERNKAARPRRPVTIPNDIDELFTPDPLTYVVSPTNKTAKPKTDGGMKSPISEKSCSPSTVTSSSAPVTGSSCRRTQNFTVTGSPHEVDTKVSSVSSGRLLQTSLPTVALERVKLESFRPFCSKESELRSSPITSSDRPLKDESVKSEEKHSSLLPSDVRPSALEADTAASEQTFNSHCSRSPLLVRQASEGRREQVNEEDPIDVELDLGLSFALDMDLTQSSHSSEDEQLLSFQEMMERVTKPPDTPEKGAFSEPSTPGHHSCQLKTQPLPTTTKSGIYKNNLDQMLKEINTNKKAKEIEAQLLTICKEDLLRIAEYEEAEENREEGISTEHLEFLQRYSLMSNAIREVPPGEVVFNLEKFGQIFNHDTLQLRQCMVSPQGTAQKTLLWSSPAQLRLHVNIGLFQEAFDCHSPCPTRVTRFLFKMMSVHSERMVSEKILQALCDIACTAAYQIVKNGSQLFKVWVPSLADVTLVLMNMGVAFVTLFPFENLQPPFTEGDLLEDIYIKSESPSSKKGLSTFPEHNCNNILKYLSYCMGLCPRAYSDHELLLLLTVLGRVGLDTWLILQSSVELYPLLYKIINNIRERDWDTMLPRICLALTDLTDDHHNMCLLVQLLPDNTRGKELRRHLSLCMISKLLDGNCTYRPSEKEIQLSELRQYLPRMQPSTLLRAMLSSSSRTPKEKEDMATLDQQSYYLCYSLLTLTNEASNFQFFPAHQKEQLMFLCSELETHVKCDIRESEKCLYRSKVKDLVARIYTKWQMLLQRTRPLYDKLYDYWQPLPVDTLTSSQEVQEVDNSDDGEVPAVEDEEEEETNRSEGNEVITTAEEEEEEEEKEEGGDTNKTGDSLKPERKEGGDATDDTNNTGDSLKPERKEGGDATDSTNEMEEAPEPEPEPVCGELNQEMPGMEPQVRSESEVMDENLVETRETSHHNQVAACNLTP
ncbi:SMC5-SMC6 complex localization factor protein 2 isoform X2 [Pempheris klunzingeri]|uniref:SMC5-SMC6 complex localization factor protein 2 isoform X2 n=1 Tax=Pempheris klunzingeri TaxID=3127111 RepID=UPI00397F49A7